MKRLAVLLFTIVFLAQTAHTQTATFVSPVVYLTNVRTPDRHTSIKKGLASSGGLWSDATAVGAVWEYNYHAQVPGSGSIESVPMISRRQNVTNTVSGNSPWLLTFNEPDLCPDQACMTVNEAVALWRTIEISHSDRLLVSPAPSQFHPEWLTQFLEACTAQGCRMPDALAAHCYWDEPACEAHVSNVIELADEWGIKGGIWVTEFAFPCSVNDLEKFVGWMEANPKVARYAYYTNIVQGAFGGTSLFDRFGKLTEAGGRYTLLP